LATRIGHGAAEALDRAPHGALEDATVSVVANDEQVEFLGRGHDPPDVVPLLDECLPLQPLDAARSRACVVNDRKCSSIGSFVTFTSLIEVA
jgi:hypothetical protein